MDVGFLGFGYWEEVVIKFEKLLVIRFIFEYIVN